MKCLGMGGALVAGGVCLEFGAGNPDYETGRSPGSIHMETSTNNPAGAKDTPDLGSRIDALLGEMDQTTARIEKAVAGAPAASPAIPAVATAAGPAPAADLSG